MEGRVEPVLVDDVRMAALLADEEAGVASRDLLHMAVMRRLGVDRIVSVDRDFDRIAGVERLDPAAFDSWMTSVGG